MRDLTTDNQVKALSPYQDIAILDHDILNMSNVLDQEDNTNVLGFHHLYTMKGRYEVVAVYAYSTGLAGFAARFGICRHHTGAIDDGCCLGSQSILLKIRSNDKMRLSNPIPLFANFKTFNKNISYPTSTFFKKFASREILLGGMQSSGVEVFWEVLCTSKVVLSCPGEGWAGMDGWIGRKEGD